MNLRSALEAIGELAAPALLAVVFVPNDAGITQGGFVGGKVHLSPPNDLLQLNGGHTLDKDVIVQLGFIPDTATDTRRQESGWQK